MTDWSHLDAYAKVIGDASEGQQAEGGYNKDNNCVPTTETIIAILYGAPDINPQDITSKTYGTSFHGGEDYGPTIATLRTLWPQCPPVTYASPPDTLAGIDAEAVQRHGIACSFHCDAAGNILTYSTGIMHVSAVMAHMAGQVHILNVERDTEIVLTEPQFAGATSGAAGQLMIFQQPLPRGDAVDKQTADFLAYVQFLLGVARLPSVADMSARGDRILQIGTLSSFWEVTGGPEGKATGGMAGWMATQVARLNALEAHLSNQNTQGQATYDPKPVEAEIATLRAEFARLHDAMAAAVAATQ